MFKQGWIWAACLISGSLTAEIVGDVEVQFPPSNYEWRHFGDVPGLTISWDDEEWIDDEEEEEECDAPLLSYFTHREGDALEIFVSTQFETDEEESEGEEENLESAQNEIDQILNQFLPNHKFVLNRYVDLGNDEGFMSFEFNDGAQDLIHGYVRAFHDQTEERMAVLIYLTTALKSERSEMVWTEVLNQARFVN